MTVSCRSDCHTAVGVASGGDRSQPGRIIFEPHSTMPVLGGDAYYCAASYDIQKLLGDNHLPVVGHIGLIPPYITWTGWRAVGKTADEVLALWRHTRKLEEVGAFAAELEVVPDRVAKFLTGNPSLVMLGMGAGKHADAQYLFTEDVCGYGRNHKPRHGKVYRNLAPELERQQNGRIAAFREFRADVDSGGCLGPEHTVSIKDDEFDAFLNGVKP